MKFDDKLIRKIIDHMNTYHRGERKAIPHEYLLFYLQGIGFVDLDSESLKEIIQKLKFIKKSKAGYYVEKR